MRTRLATVIVLMFLILASALMIIKIERAENWTCVDAKQSERGAIVLLRSRYSDGTARFMDYFGHSDSQGLWWLTAIDVESLGIVRGRIRIISPDRAIIRYGLETLSVQWTNRQFEVQKRSGHILLPSHLFNPDQVKDVEAAVRRSGLLN